MWNEFFNKDRDSDFFEKEDFNLKKEIRYTSEYTVNKNSYITYELKYVEKDDSYSNSVGVRVIF